VLFGKASGFAADVNVSTLDGSNGFSLTGEGAGDTSGVSVASAGDINDDGFSDIIIGAPRAEPPGFGARADHGASYVVYGIAPDTAVTLDGTRASQTLAGGAFDDLLRGRGGDDTLHGNGGTDILNGGTGNDVLIGGAGKDALFGGAGSDVFKLTGVADSGVGGAHRDVIHDFEQGSDTIDLSAIDANSNTAANDAFTFVGTAAFSHTAGEVRQFTAQDGATVVAGDVDGDGVADFQIALSGSLTLHGSDFIL
jgi:Ca2+-binding RTX toxin-like protein